MNGSESLTKLLLIDYGHKLARKLKESIRFYEQQKKIDRESKGYKRLLFV